jgi:hypothetical protein
MPSVLGEPGGLIGRKPEQKVLQRALESAEAELVAVYGRHRVGKTFLVREFFRDQIRFELTGVRDAPLPSSSRISPPPWGNRCGSASSPRSHRAGKRHSAS